MTQPARTYSNDELAIAWYPNRCIHSARCITSLPKVFDPRRRPWIELGDETADRLAAAVERCPTGALHYRRTDGGPQEQAAEETTITPVPNGPLYVRGNVQIVDAEDRLIREDVRMALCRCGSSANKPFCDNSHLRVRFQAP